MKEKIAVRNYGMDILRVLACYMVIQIHAGEFYYIGDGGLAKSGAGVLQIDLLNSLFRTAVPLFIMISGYFLLPVKDTLNVFFRKRFTRVLIPFVFWCILYAFYQVFQGDATVQDALINILKIPVNFGVEVGHLWYIYMLMGLYLFAPIISPWLQTASRRGIELYLGLWIVSLCLPYIHLVFPEILGECFWNKTPLLYYFTGFLGYLISGFYIRKYFSGPAKWHIPASLFLIVAGYAITAGGFASQIGKAVFVPELEITWGFESINVAMMAWGIFIIFNRLKIRDFSSTTGKVITDISKYSYGIYLVHIMVLNAFYNLFNPMWESVPVKLFCISVCTFIVSYMVIKLISFIPKSKYLIG